MNRRTVLVSALALAAAALLVVPACVELTGQRISWFHDQAKDRLVLLLHYDGIHESDRDTDVKGKEQIPKFVQNGDVMLMDWPFHFDMERLRDAAKKEDSIQREAAQLILSVRSEPLGYYREPDGRIGGVQRVTIPGITAFLRKVNGLLSRAAIEGKLFDEEARDLAPRTIERVLAAARQEHQWITLDGHAIRVSFPVHPGEWAAIRGRALKDWMRDVIRKFREDEKTIGYWVQAGASAPISYLDEGERVTFVLGYADRPVTWRIRLRDDYEPSLEPVVEAAVKIDRDRVLAASLLAADPESKAGPESPDFGPPEEGVRAMIGLVERGSDSEKKAAAEYLGKWAARWNDRVGVPAAPATKEGTELDLAAWKDWYRRMKQFPALPESESRAPNPGK